MTSAGESVSTFPLSEAALSGALAVERKLGDFESVTGQLVADQVAHQAYELDGRAGNQVRLRVTSDAFHVVAFVVLVARGKSFWKVVPGVVPSSSHTLGGPDLVPGGVEAQSPVTIPTDGVYRVVVTSVENQAARRPTSTGEYRMTLLVDAPTVEPPVESERGTRFSAWESEPR